MPNRDIIVVGASAGCIEALRGMVAHLPRDLQATLFVVLHIPPYSPSTLPSILSAAGPLPATHPADGERVRPGHIYVTPPDHHLLIEGAAVLVRRGPKENRFRPSVDAQFCSAAYVYGPRVIGVVLSDALDDGSSGLWTVKRLGGLAVIQEPSKVAHPDMPLSAQEFVDVDHCVRLKEMGPLLARLCQEQVPKDSAASEEERARIALEISIAVDDNAFEKGIMKWGELTPFTCPECHGVLVKLQEGKLARFRCHTGRAFTPSALLIGITAVVGETMWGLEEATMLLWQMGDEFQSLGRWRPHSCSSKRRAKRRRMHKLCTIRCRSMTSDRN